ncbi:MAG: winged helix-turn-helix domain-containing protein [Patescibacteria group bacterium]
MGSIKNSRQMERHFKGIANHWRIEILQVVRDNPDSSVDELATMVGGHFKTISEHTRRLVQAGLLQKTYRGRTVVHALSPYGKIFVRFIKSFQHS